MDTMAVATAPVLDLTPEDLETIRGPARELWSRYNARMGDTLVATLL